MASVEKIVAAMRRSPIGVSFNDLVKVCEPWPGDPRVNIQNDKGKAKAYQVRQVLAAIDKKEAKS